MKRNVFFNLTNYINFQTIRTMSNGKVTSKTFGYDMKFVKYAEEGVIVAPKKQEEDPGE